MSVTMDDSIKRWTAKRKAALVVEIIQGKTTVAEASRAYDLSPSEIEGWVDDAIPARLGKRCLGLLLGSLQHALSQFGVLERQIELVGRQLLGTLAKAVVLRGAQNTLEATVGLLHLRECRLDLGQAGLQMGVLAAEGVGIHARSESR